jgi:hypothetical protein
MIDIQGVSDRHSDVDIDEFVEYSANQRTISLHMYGLVMDIDGMGKP